MAAAKKELLKAVLGAGKGGPASAVEADEFADYEAPEDPAAAGDDEALFQDALAQFFPGMTEEEYLQFHRVANAKLGG